ncbi:hypothetical protein [Tatumella saanichensis]|uniref:hypothetical protein n=1 Tax=Tatumella saanichensis TaxID=480813 RepID=UPI0004A2C33F|nr:hypothetical protein [Tatumella saanichensis]
MKFIGKCLLILLLILMLAVIAGYFLLKSTWGAATLSRLISDETDWHLSIGRIRHTFSDPLAVTLQDFSFGHDGQPALIVAKDVTLNLSLLQFSQPSHFAALTLSNGEIDLANSLSGTTVPLQADHLYLNGMRIVQPATGRDFTAQDLQAEISPWKPAADQMTGNHYQFSLDLGELSLSGQILKKITSQGSVDAGKLTLDALSGQAERGTFSGKMSRDARGQWQIQQLALQNTRFQTEKSLSQFLQPLEQQNIHPAQIAINHATIIGPDWSVTDLTLQLNNPQLPDDGLLAPGGQLTAAASTFVYDNNEFSQPQASISDTAQGYQIHSLKTAWMNGNLATSGQWLRDTRQLTLDTLSLSGLEYTLPENWRQLWMTPLPAAIDSVLVHQLTVSHTLLIDINPDFPFQMTGLNGTGSELMLAKQGQWGIWSGQSEWKANEATFNRQDIRAPWLKLSADNQQITVNDLKMLVDNGPMIGKATLSQQPSRQFSLSLQGQNVPLPALSHWGWPVTADGNGDFTLSAQGNLQAATALRPTVNGTLTLSTASGKTVQSMHNGVTE